jgi:hypothetical protein
MGPRDGLTLALVVAIAIGGASGCKRPAPNDAPPPPPADRLAPGEVALSKDKAFALPLPRSARIGSRYGGTIYVATDMSPEELANFVRGRVKGGTITAGTSSTMFESVTVPAEPKRTLTVEVRAGRNCRSEMLVHDVTPDIDPNAKTDDDRWKRAGFDKDGHPIDPRLMH